MDSFGRNSVSFCASMAEVMPPPMMQMSDSCAGMSNFLTTINAETAEPAEP
jgi:hypothetical protein